MSLPQTYTLNGMPPVIQSGANVAFFAWVLQTYVVQTAPLLALLQYQSTGGYEVEQVLTPTCNVSINGSNVILSCSATDNSNASYTFNAVALLVPEFEWDGQYYSWVIGYGTGNLTSSYTKGSNQSVTVSLQLTLTVPLNLF